MKAKGPEYIWMILARWPFWRWLDYLRPGELRCKRCGCGWAGGLGKCRQGHGGQGHAGQGRAGQGRAGQGRCRLGVGGQGRCRQADGDGEHQSAPGEWSMPRKTKGCLGTWRSGTGPASGALIRIVGTRNLHV